MSTPGEDRGNKTPNDPVKEQIAQDKFGKSYDELDGELFDKAVYIEERRYAGCNCGLSFSEPTFEWCCGSSVATVCTPLLCTGVSVYLMLITIDMSVIITKAF